MKVTIGFFRSYDNYCLGKTEIDDSLIPDGDSAVWAWHSDENKPVIIHPWYIYRVYTGKGVDVLVFDTDMMDIYGGPLDINEYYETFKNTISNAIDIR